MKLNLPVLAPPGSISLEVGAMLGCKSARCAAFGSNRGMAAYLHRPSMACSHRPSFCRPVPNFELGVVIAWSATMNHLQHYLTKPDFGCYLRCWKAYYCYLNDPYAAAYSTDFMTNLA